MHTDQVRIIGGNWRGRKLTILNQPGLRPTTDRIRETVFNWLMNDVHDAVCLDAFSGTGALGFEALSRGAKQVSFCEQNKEVAQQLQKNSETLKCIEHCDIIDNNFFETDFDKKFNIIFLDPPFKQDLLIPAISKAQQLLTAAGIIYAEAEAEFTMPKQLNPRKHKAAGQVQYFLI